MSNYLDDVEDIKNVILEQRGELIALSQELAKIHLAIKQGEDKIKNNIDMFNTIQKLNKESLEQTLKNYQDLILEQNKQGAEKYSKSIENIIKELAKKTPSSSTTQLSTTLWISITTATIFSLVFYILLRAKII